MFRINLFARMNRALGEHKRVNIYETINSNECLE